MELCLRALRQYTDGPSYEIIVVDNGSQGESLEFLKSLSWIRLVDRGDQTPEKWIHAMNTALDIGLSMARGKYYLIMHSDTIVKRKGWLDRLVTAIETDEHTAASGTEKLEVRSRLRLMLKDATDTKRFRLWIKRTFLGDSTEALKLREPCPRDFAALYRTNILRENNLSFIGRDDYSAGDTMYRDLKELGYKAQLVDVREMMTYMDHIAHASGSILPERELKNKRMLVKTRLRLKRLFKRDDIAQLLNDPSLLQTPVQTTTSGS